MVEELSAKCQEVVSKMLTAFSDSASFYDVANVHTGQLTDGEN